MWYNFSTRSGKPREYLPIDRGRSEPFGPVFSQAVLFVSCQDTQNIASLGNTAGESPGLFCLERVVVVSVKIMGQVWDLELPYTEKLVLLAYADHSDHEGRNIYPSVNLIAEKTGYSERHVQRITRELQKKKLLILEGEGKGGRNLTRKYHIPVDKKGDILSPFNSKRVTSTPERVTPESLKGDSGVTRTIINHLINPLTESEEDKLPTSEEYKASLRQTLMRMNERETADPEVEGIERYPEDIKDIIRAVCKLWNLRPPNHPRQPNNRSPSSQWIQDARYLEEACGEFGVEALRSYHAQFRRYMQE